MKAIRIVDDPSAVKHRMDKQFRQIQWDKELEQHTRDLVRLAVREDLGRLYDWTTVALVPGETLGRASVVTRQPGVVAGLNAAEVAIDEMDCRIDWTATVSDGEATEAGQTIADLSGSTRDLLTAERLLLNLIGHLSGIATITRQFVDLVRHTSAEIYDTRKTTPGYRLLEKYAVRCGGGINHRTGLFEAVLIKDNHLALGAGKRGVSYSPAEAVTHVRRFLDETLGTDKASKVIVEVEVDSLEQLRNALSARPDIVLLDNMTPEQLIKAVALRDQLQVDSQLEASGGVTLTTIAAIAKTGVERISVGAITHSAPYLDVAMDWRNE